MMTDEKSTDDSSCESTGVHRHFDKLEHQIEQRILACAKLLEALGWCVAVRLSHDRLWLGENAVHSLKTEVPDTWSALLRCLESRWSKSPSLDQPGIKIWNNQIDRKIEVEENLTKREIEVFGLLRDGKTSPEISQILGCSKRTVEKHVENIYHKRGLRDRASAILLQHPLRTRNEAPS